MNCSHMTSDSGVFLEFLHGIFAWYFSANREFLPSFLTSKNTQAWEGDIRVLSFVFSSSHFITCIVMNMKPKPNLPGAMKLLLLQTN